MRKIYALVLFLILPYGASAQTARTVKTPDAVYAETLPEQITCRHIRLSGLPKRGLVTLQFWNILNEEWTVNVLRAFINRTEQVISDIGDDPILIPKRAIRINVAG